MVLWKRLAIVLLAANGACAGTDDGSTVSPAAGNGDAGQQVPDASSGPTADSGSPASPPADAGGDAASAPASDGGAKDAAAAKPPLMLEIPTSQVPCAGAPCDTLTNVCCASWGRSAGFGTEESCVTRDACYQKFARSGDSNRAVTRECDGKEDCSAGQVCCVYADGMPLFANFLDPTDLQGPGGSTICADIADCTYNNKSTFVAAGIPLGELECNDDSDCADRPDTRCRPEADNSHSTGVGVKARSDIKVCQ